MCLSCCSSLFTEPRGGKVPAKRLEENVSSHRRYRCVYSLMVGAGAVERGWQAGDEDPPS